MEQDQIKGEKRPASFACLPPAYRQAGQVGSQGRLLDLASNGKARQMIEAQTISFGNRTRLIGLFIIRKTPPCIAERGFLMNLPIYLAIIILLFIVPFSVYSITK